MVCTALSILEADQLNRLDWKCSREHCRGGRLNTVEGRLNTVEGRLNTVNVNLSYF